MNTESKPSELPNGAEKASVLFGEFGPNLAKGLPVQAFMKGSLVNTLISKRLKNRSEEPVLSYLEDLSAKGSADDVVGKLLDAHQKELIGVLTSMKASGILEGTSSEPRSMAERANDRVDLAEKIVAEIEAFLLVVMNTEVIQYRQNPSWIFGPKGRNALLRRFKNRFVHTFEGDGALPEPWRSLFLKQLENAFKRVHKNHPVRWFLGTILFEVKKNPAFIENAPWTGMGADLDENLMEIIRKKSGDSPFSENRFWFCRPSIESVNTRTDWTENAFFFSVQEKSFNAEDQKSGHFSSGTDRKRVVLYDNAGAYSYYDDALFSAETAGASGKSRQSFSSPGEKDEYFGPVAFSYGNRSFRLSKFVDGFRHGDFDSCFMDSEWCAYKPLGRQNAPLFGSTLSSGAKKNFVHPGAQVSPKILTDGAFDYSEIMDGFSGTVVYGSLKECTFISGWGSGNIGEGIVVPETIPDADLNRTSRSNSEALKSAIVIGEKVFLRAKMSAGGKGGLFLGSCNGAAFLGSSAMGAIFHQAGNGASFSGESGASAKVSDGSLLWPGTKISDHAFQYADVSGTVGTEAELSEFPFKDAKRVDSKDHAEILRGALERKIHLLASSITSWAASRNDTIENAILDIPFGSNEWNSAISKEEAVIVKGRLKWLLSSKFKEQEKERKLREELKMVTQDGSEEWIRAARKKIALLGWKTLFQTLLDNPAEASRSLERFPAETVLFNLENWTSPDENGTPGISERAAKSVIEKITMAINQMHRSVSEENKRLVIVQLCNAHASVGTASGNLKQYSFERAKFTDVSPEFWEKFEILVGSVTLAKKLKIMNAPKKK